MSDINLIREDTESIRLRFKRNGVEAVPNGFAEGDIFILTLRNRRDEVALTKTITYPELTFYLSSNDTAKLTTSPYRYDIEYNKPNPEYDGTNEQYSITKTFIIGNVNVSQDVTRRTPW